MQDSDRFFLGFILSGIFIWLIVISFLLKDIISILTKGG